MKKGNSVTRKVRRRRRRIGGRDNSNKPDNHIITIPGTQRPPPPPTPTPTPTPTDLRVNGPGNVNETLSLLRLFERNGGRTYKNKYKTKTPIKPKPP